MGEDLFGQANADQALQDMPDQAADSHSHSCKPASSQTRQTVVKQHRQWVSSLLALDVHRCLLAQGTCLEPGRLLHSEHDAVLLVCVA